MSKLLVRKRQISEQKKVKVLGVSAGTTYPKTLLFISLKKIKSYFFWNTLT